MSESRRGTLYAAGYLLALMLLVIPLFELVANAWPPVPSAPRWRYGAAGFLGNNLLMPLLGVSVGIATAVLMGHRRIRRFLAAVSVGGGILLLASAGMLGFDGLQLRGGVNPSFLRSFDIAAAKAFITLGLGAVLLTWIGLAAWSTGLGGSRGTRRRREGSEKLVLEGSPTTHGE